MHEKNPKRGLIDLSRPVGPSRMHTHRSKRAKDFIAHECRRAQPMQFILTLLGLVLETPIARPNSSECKTDQ